jgi:hypothetical protein
MRSGDRSTDLQLLWHVKHERTNDALMNDTIMGSASSQGDAQGGGREHRRSCT